MQNEKPSVGYPVSKLSRGWGREGGKNGERACNDVSGI